MLCLPPAAVMRFCSSASSGLWSFVSALAVAPAKGGCAPPPEKSTCMGCGGRGEGAARCDEVWQGRGEGAVRVRRVRQGRGEGAEGAEGVEGAEGAPHASLPRAQSAARRPAARRPQRWCPSRHALGLPTRHPRR
eukprot:scaffold84134_cov48-Phaeocystis_antarctica.AAC.1